MIAGRGVLHSGDRFRVSDKFLAGTFMQCSCVVHEQRRMLRGAGSFVMAAEDYNSFGRAMVRKLIAEIATSPERQRSVSTMNVQARTIRNSSSKTWMLSAQGPHW